MSLLKSTSPMWTGLIKTALLYGSLSLLATFVQAGAACVIAKEQGNSLAIEWTTDAVSVQAAIEQAKQALRSQGHQYLFPQSNSSLATGWLIIIKTEYRTRRGRLRTSYGCGFHQNPLTAEQMAQSDLQSYSWGWRPEMSYTIYDKIEF